MVRTKEIQKIVKQLQQINETDTLSHIFSDADKGALFDLCEQLNIFIEKQMKQQEVETKNRSTYQKMLSNISHDLKTPLTVVKGMSELIDFEKKSVTENTEMLDKMKQKIEEVQETMTLFFDLSKLESDDINFNFSNVNIVELSKQVLLEYYDTLENQEILLDVDFPEEPIYVNGDRAALVRIINNLISNAVKYGSKGKIIGCRINNRMTEVELIVWDKGVGIEEKYYHQIFERLFTLEDSRNRHYAGSGLGLTITKRLIEKHHGHIEVTSTPNEYTEFKVILPISAENTIL